MLPPSQQDSEKEGITEEIAEKVDAKSEQEKASYSTPSSEKTEDEAGSLSLLINKLINRLIDTPSYRKIAAGALFIFISIAVIISADSDDTRIWMTAAGAVVLILWGSIGWINKLIMSGLVLAFLFLYFFSGKAQEGLYKLKDDWKERHMQIENLHQPSD